VYWFLSENGKVLYVGKAKNLRNRVRSYTQVKRLNNRIKQLSTTATTLKFQILESELEALLVEAELIRTHQPKYNILLKDDKTPLYIHITKEDFPRVLTLRKKEVMRKKPQGTILGPFPSAYKTKEVLKLVRKIFKWCKNPQGGKACFYYHIDLCSGACVGEISSPDYKENIKNLLLFLKGKKKTVIKQIKEEMVNFSKNEKFEKAQIRKEQIDLIEEVTKKKLSPNLTLPQLQLTRTLEGLTYLQKILSDYSAIPKEWPLTTIEGYDVSNIQGTNPTVSLVTFTDGQPDKSKYKIFNIKNLNTPNDYAMMKEALIRRQNHPEWGKPDLIMVDGGKGQVRATLGILHWQIPVIGLVKNPDRIVIPLIDKENKASKGKQKIDYKIIRLDSGHPTLNILQQIRDESHRFAQKQHKKLRTKEMFK
jgi:excinuclease ABC subunit C